MPGETTEAVPPIGSVEAVPPIILEGDQSGEAPEVTSLSAVTSRSLVEVLGNSADIAVIPFDGITGYMKLMKEAGHSSLQIMAHPHRDKTLILPITKLRLGYRAHDSLMFQDGEVTNYDPPNKSYFEFILGPFSRQANVIIDLVSYEEGPIAVRYNRRCKYNGHFFDIDAVSSQNDQGQLRCSGQPLPDYQSVDSDLPVEDFLEKDANYIVSNSPLALFVRFDGSMCSLYAIDTGIKIGECLPKKLHLFHFHKLDELPFEVS